MHGHTLNIAMNIHAILLSMYKIDPIYFLCRIIVII
jgi:hypothetical protein